MRGGKGDRCRAHRHRPAAEHGCTEGERAIKSRKLAKTVEIWSGLPVRMWDERQTTCAAADLLDESGTFGTKRKEILDSVSATVILDDYLAWRKEHPGEI